MNDVWRLLDLGAVDGYTMTNLYEAVGHSISQGKTPNTIIFNHPEAPFVNIGYHQLMEKEINVDYVKQQRFDLVRRTIGGGAILDGPWEQDYFVVISRNSPKCPPSMQEFYQNFLKPPVAALRILGIEAQVRPPNDILVKGKKISGNGAITIDRANVLAGDLLLESPVDLMSKIIKAPSEKFKDKLADSMEEWITSIRGEKGAHMSRGEVKKALFEGFESELGIILESGELTKGEKKTLEKLVEERRTEDWIFSKDDDFRSMIPKDRRGTKVRGGLVVSEAVHKAGKLVRVNMVSEEDVISAITISGDFFTMPYTGAIQRLEKSLEGTPLIEEALKQRVKEAFIDIGLIVVGADQDDFVKVIMKAQAAIP